MHFMILKLILESTFHILLAKFSTKNLFSWAIINICGWYSCYLFSIKVNNKLSLTLLFNIYSSLTIPNRFELCFAFHLVDFHLPPLLSLRRMFLFIHQRQDSLHPPRVWPSRHGFWRCGFRVFQLSQYLQEVYEECEETSQSAEEVESPEALEVKTVGFELWVV